MQGMKAQSQDGKPAAFAIAAHPDDIEFMMAGTLILLREAGWAIHYLNLANGSHGTANDNRAEIIARRRLEAQEACCRIGAHFHESLCDDLALEHTPAMVAQVLAIIRQVRPCILLTVSPQDYMEDHINASRVAVTAAFARGMPVYHSHPPEPPFLGELTIYHALPYGLCDQLRRRIRPGQYVDVSPAMQLKREMLAAHTSQQEWLDLSQGLNSYLNNMVEQTREVGRMSGRFEYAEGWRRHLHLGFSAADQNPLSVALGAACSVDAEYERRLNYN
jgi:N-acetylglucosamine malate deacetylase 1